MKIALVIFRADPARGGAERYTADLAAALAARGHGVDLVSTQFGPVLSDVRFVEIKANAATRLGRFKQFWSALDAHLARSEYDIVHAMLPVRHCDIYHPHAGLARENLSARLMNRLSSVRRKFAAVEGELLTGSRPPIVLCLSDDVKSTVARNYPGIEPRLKKLFNAVDLKRFDPTQTGEPREKLRRRFGIDANAIVALMIAQDFERKGLPQTIKAMASLKSRAGASNLKLLVVGKEDTSTYAQQARQLGISDRVIFAGPTDSPADFYRAADFFVLPTRHDPCSLVVLEALAMGLPVISTVFNGACEIMRESEHGYIVQDPDDIPALAAAMANLLDPARRDLMRSACLALRPGLAFENHLDCLESIYQSK